MAKHFIRGSQTALHFLRMFGQVSRKLLKFSLLLYLLCTWAFFYYSSTDYQRYLLGQYVVAQLSLAIKGDMAIQDLRAFNGRSLKMQANTIIRHPLIKEVLQLSENALWNSSWVIAGFIIIVVVYLSEKGRRQLISKDIRGAVFLDPERIRTFLKQQKKMSDLEIAGVPLVLNSETQHILITGTTGSGKSLCMMELMDGIRRRKQRAIVYDVVGSFIQHYYREDRDIILNPLDERCPIWNIWQEGADLADFESHAASLIPLASAGDPFWTQSARTIFSYLAQKLQEANDTKTQSFLKPLLGADLKVLNDLLRGTPAETLVNESLEKMALSIKATAAAYCKCLNYLQDEGAVKTTDQKKSTDAAPLFSIKKWLQNENQDGWIFIASNAEKLEAIKPLISLWMDIAARAVLSLKTSSERRIWFLIDELASLHKLPSLSLLLSQGRKYGASVVTAFQDIHQLRSIYGRDESEALTAMYNTNLCYRTKCPDTAQWMSRVVGQHELVEKKEGFSYGANDVRDGVSMHQERRKEALILDTEFLRLNDREAYLILPANVPITKIKLEFKERSSLADMWVPRKIVEPQPEKGSVVQKSTLPESINTRASTASDPASVAAETTPGSTSTQSSIQVAPIRKRTSVIASEQCLKPKPKSIPTQRFKARVLDAYTQQERN